MTETKQPYAAQRTKEWSEQRRGLITASSVGAILNLDPNRDQVDIMRQMVRDWHGAEREFNGNIATEWGIGNEETALGQLEMIIAPPVYRCGFIVSEKYPWLGASPDGLIGDDGVIEVKCPYGIRDDEKPVFKPLADQPHYYAQMQVQMICTWRGWGVFYQWTPHGERLENCYVSGEWIRENIPKLRDFYGRYLIERENPAQYLEPKRPVINTIDAKLLMDEYLDLSATIDVATERKRDLLAKLVALAGEKNALIWGRNLTKVEKQGPISYAKAIKELCPDADLEKWRGKPSEYWMIK